jgi:hypothetical protein
MGDHGVPINEVVAQTFLAKDKVKEALKPLKTLKPHHAKKIS